MTRILGAQEEKGHRRAPMDSEPALPWNVLTASGLAIAVVGWIDLALLWYPLLFGNREWEFATISAHLNGMPLSTVGLALFVAGAIGRGWRRVSRAVSIFCLLVVAGLVLISILYLLDIPIALRASPPPLKQALKKAILKAGVLAVTYTVLYAWLARFLWRSTSTSKV